MNQNTAIINTPVIADLHCDLLCYLSHDPQRSAYDLAVRCSIPQLKSGNVKWQIMAIFTETGAGSVDSGTSQATIFRNLAKQYPGCFYYIHNKDQLYDLKTSEGIGICPAIENASSFCDEQEPLASGFQRLETMMRRIGKPAYISLTWNTENRFGGGALTTIGLKSDGKKLIDLMSQKKIPIDLSHASDPLVEDIFNYLEKHRLDTPVLASHSNFRAIAHVPRNLPDAFAQAILARKGIIGMNFVRSFVGAESAENFVRQLEWGLKLTKGGKLAEGISFGADFFYGQDVSPGYRKLPDDLFFPGYNEAGTYPHVIKMWREHLLISDEVLTAVCHGNAVEFFARYVYC